MTTKPKPEKPDRRVQKQGRTDVEVDAPIDAVWQAVRDVARVGEWSHECTGIEWVAPADRAEPGARFRGRNRQGVFRWGRVCEITTCEPYELVWRTVPTALYPDSTEWRIRLEATENGTRIEQSFQALKVPKVLDVLYALMIPAHRDRTEALREDLRRLGALAAPVPTVSPAR